MRKKIFYISVFLIFGLLLSSCTGELLTDKELIVKVIDDFFSAINEQKWDLAKSYCIDEGAYEFVDMMKEQFEDFSSKCNTLTVKFSPDISKVDIDGTDAHAYGYLTIFLKCDGKENSDVWEFMSGLLKVSHNWKLFK
jgi:hypothetical protein